MGGLRAQLTDLLGAASNMLRNFTHYLLALVVLSSAALVYNAYSKLWLQPPEFEKVAIADRESVPVDTMGDLFPTDAWQRGPCKRLQTTDGELLFEHWEQITENHWKLWPITLVIGRGMDDQQDPEPIILDAVEGAEIRFTESLNMMSANAPPIERGQMIGEVTIRRPTNDPTKSPLLIRTSDIGIDNRKIWTTKAIQLTMGETRMVGRDLTLHLATSAISGHGGSAASILDRMELIYLDELTIPLKNNALAKSQGKHIDPILPASTLPASPAHRSSAGMSLKSLSPGGLLPADLSTAELSPTDLSQEGLLPPVAPPANHSLTDSEADAQHALTTMTPVQPPHTPSGQAAGSPPELSVPELSVPELNVPDLNAPQANHTDSSIETHTVRRSALTPQAEAYLKINCDGRVEYDFALDQLSLRDRISLVHHVPGVGDDQFTCEVLELRFRDPDNRQLVRSGPLDWINHIEATGNPVVVDLPSLDCHITADQIEFDAIGGLLQVSGGAGVQIRRGMVAAKLSRLSYQYNPADPQGIGTIDTFGWGIVKLLDPDHPVREFKWSNSFKLQPIGQSTPGKLDSDVSVVVNGDVQARFSDGGDFRADTVDGVLRSVSVTQPPNDPSVVHQPEKPKQTFRPDWFRAIGDVHLDNQAVGADTQQLQLYFVDEPNPNSQGYDVVEGEQRSSPLRQWVAQPNDQSQPTAPLARPRPSVTGDNIVAKLRINDAGISVIDLSVKGNVDLTHSIEASGRMLPANLTGNELRLTSEAGRDVLQLSSRPDQPSRFELGDGFFVGPRIDIWPSDNIVRIDGGGKFLMPTAILPQSLAANQVNQIRWTQAPKCMWNGQMVFDGKTAVLTGGVDITASMVNQDQPWSIHMIGDRLEVELLEQIEIGQMQSLRSAAIQQVTLLQSQTQPVLIQAEQFAADGVREGRHVLQAARLSLLPSGDGKLIGVGPGWYRAWMYADNKGPFTPLDKKEVPRSGPTSDRSLMGVHLIYHQAMQGDLINKSLSFLREVRVGVKQVRHWSDTFDANEMDAISSGESTIDCDALQISIAPTNPNLPKIPGLSTPWEVQARDGVVFRTRSDDGLVVGTADRAVYSSQKEIFSIFGSPNRGAVVQRTDPNGQPGPRIEMEKMLINPKTLEFNIEMQNASSGRLPSQLQR